MRIDLDGRTFIVTLDDAGVATIIKERRVYRPGTYLEAFYNATYWHHSQRRPSRGTAFRVIEEAERRHKGTPWPTPLTAYPPAKS